MTRRRSTLASAALIASFGVIGWNVAASDDGPALSPEVGIWLLAAILIVAAMMIAGRARRPRKVRPDPFEQPYGDVPESGVWVPPHSGPDRPLPPNWMSLGEAADRSVSDLIHKRGVWSAHDGERGQ